MNARAQRSDRGWKAVIEISCDGDFRSRNADRDCERNNNPNPIVDRQFVMSAQFQTD